MAALPSVPRRGVRSRGEDGSATVYVLIAIVLVMALTAVVLAVAVATRARHRATAAADAAALAAAGSALGGPDAACRHGAELAAVNQGRLVRCAVADAIADVTVAVPLPGALRFLGPAIGRARAAPASVSSR
jgi:secretion/DNA translocation related TadE-like protein